MPEIAKEDLKRSWERFELVAKAKECDEDRQHAIVPMLLHGKLFDAYIELPEDTAEVKGSTGRTAGTICDSLSATISLPKETNEERKK